MTITPVKFEDCFKCGTILYRGAQRDAHSGDVLLIRSRKPNRDTERIISMTFPVSRDIQRVLNKQPDERDCIDEEMIQAHTEVLHTQGYSHPLCMFLEDFFPGWKHEIIGKWHEAHGYCSFKSEDNVGVYTKRYVAIYPNTGCLDGGELARQIEFHGRRCNGSLINFPATMENGVWYAANVG